ncbi:unnamed protein product [Urochloa humidicola]
MTTYTDDTMLILCAEEDQVHHFKLILDNFTAMTGLHINFNKSTFILNSVDRTRATWCQSWDARSPLSQTYMRLSLSTSKISDATLDTITVKAKCTVPGWRISLLSKVSRLTMAESVLMALAIYAISILPFPLTTLPKINWPRKGWWHMLGCLGAGLPIQGW